MCTEFLPQDRLRRARDKFHKRPQKTFVYVYLTEFWNTLLAIPRIIEAEKHEEFYSSLKPLVKLKVLKLDPTTFDQAAQGTLNFDSVLFGASLFHYRGGLPSSFSNSRPLPMEIGNFERSQRHCRKRKLGRNKLSKPMKRGLQLMHVLLAINLAAVHEIVRMLIRTVL